MNYKNLILTFYFHFFFALKRRDDEYDDYYKYFTRQNLKYKYLRKNVSVVQEMFSTSLNFQEITGLRNGRGLFLWGGG